MSKFYEFIYLYEYVRHFQKGTVLLCPIQKLSFPGMTYHGILERIFAEHT